VDTVFLALRVVVALGAVFGALLLAHRWITKGRPGAQPRNRQISVVARQGLGAKAGVAVVDAGGRRYLLGVTEHAVTVLDTLGPAQAPTGEPSLVAAQPIQAARFEQELRTVTIATADVPVVVHGAADPARPGGPITQTVAIMPGGMTPAQRSAAAITFTRSVPVQPPAAPAAPAAYPSRRAMREAEQAAEPVTAAPQPAVRAEGRPQQPQQGPLAGSVLSPATWRQTFDALKQLR
jgi:flagellar biosynthetic protein FliO